MNTTRSQPPLLLIRPAVAADAPAIAALHAESWRSAYASVLDPEFLAGPIDADRLAVWRLRLAEPAPGQIVLVAEDPGGGIVGFICVFRDADLVWGSLIDNLHIAPALRGGGMGEILMRRAADLLAAANPQGALHLWVFEANAAARRFYERLGGEVTGEEPSPIPAAHGRTVLRVCWSNPAAVGARSR